MTSAPSDEPIAAGIAAFLALPENEALAAEIARGRAELERHAEGLRARAMAGDVEAAGDLMYLLPNDRRGDEVARAFDARMPVPAFRRLLSDAWDHDHVAVWRAAGSDRRVFNRWFRYAAFDLSALPEELTIWRGGTCPPWALGSGLSWTTNRATACWFAHVYHSSHGRPGQPVVISRTVRRRQLLYWSEERNEAEVIPAARGPVTVDRGANQVALAAALG